MAKISEENKIEKDNIEAAFLECDENIIDKIVPKKELENFEIDIKEIMKSGCNRQIAEYSLMQYKNNTSKNEYSKYETRFMSIYRIFAQQFNLAIDEDKSFINNMWNNVFWIFFIPTVNISKTDRTSFDFTIVNSILHEKFC